MVRGQPGAVLNKQAAVLGSPIRHSLSPVLHRAAYRALGLPWSYRAIEVDVPALRGFLEGLDDSWAGLSLTMPLKEAVLPLLDDVAALALATRSVNTVVLGRDARVGHNTDVAGIVAAVEGQVGADGPESVTVLGSGATARSAAAAAVQLGARHAVIVARRQQAAADVAATATALGMPETRTREWDAPGDALNADLVISTVPGDAARTMVPLLPEQPRVLLDVTYHPWPTALAGAWTRAGGVAVSGAQMLLWQAVAQVELMTGLQAPVNDMADALQAALAG